jgi:acyl carrier protein
VSQTTSQDRQAAIERWVIDTCVQLGLPVAAGEDDFFDAGGTSLAVIRMIARAEEEYGADALSPEELIEQSSVREIAATIFRNTAVGTPAGAPDH